MTGHLSAAGTLSAPRGRDHPGSAAGPHPARFAARTRIRWEKTTAVAVKIKLKRLGKIREPHYRIVVADARTKRDGRAIEEIGKYHPKEDPSLIEVDSERAQYWLSRRRAADRAGRGDPRGHRRLAEVQGPAGRRGHAAGRGAQAGPQGDLRRRCGRGAGRQRRTTPKGARPGPGQGRDAASGASAAEGRCATAEAGVTRLRRRTRRPRAARRTRRRDADRRPTARHGRDAAETARPRPRRPRRRTLRLRRRLRRR